MGLKQLVRDLFPNPDPNFWGISNCKRLLKLVLTMAVIRWSPTGEIVTEDWFWSLFRNYSQTLHKYPTSEGIVTSWFDCLRFLRSKGHKVVLNTFGIDARRVIEKSALDQRRT